MRIDQNRHQYSLEQAIKAAPVLAALQERVHESQRYLVRISPLIPIALRSRVTPGPIHNKQWCLIVSDTAASSKLRQLLPLLLQTLADEGPTVTSIRIKVQNRL